MIRRVGSVACIASRITLSTNESVEDTKPIGWGSVRADSMLLIAAVVSGTQ
jgi:hypothetical protein